MNIVILDGQVDNAPRMLCDRPPHIVFALRHPSPDGPKPYELFPINAWGLTAIWGAHNLREGQPISVEGYLTQWNRPDVTIDQITASRLVLLTE